MDLSSLLIFAGALLVAAASPGPGVAAIVARVLGRGMQGAFAFTAGMALGDLIWLSCAVLGLAAIAQTFGGVFLVMEVKVDRSDAKPLRLFLGGLAVTMGNPKVMIFYLALLPTIIEMARVSWLGWLELSIVTLAVLAIVFSSYVLLAVRTRKLIANTRAMRLLNRFTGAVMASAAAAVASR